MPSRRAYCALLLGAVTALAAPSWAQNASDDAAAPQETADTYTIQSGDTLSRISRRFGIPADALVRANDLSHPDRLTAGHVLRLPVTSPRPPAVKPPQEPAAPAPQAQTAQAQPGQTPWDQSTPPRPQPTPPPAQAQTTQAQPAQAQPTPAQPVKAPQPPATPSPQPTAKEPAAAPAPEAPAPNRTVDTDHQAAGLYRHPTLGAMRLSQGPDGVILTKNNQNIALRRLLYAIYDGADAAGNVHTIDLVFDAEGHVTALRYSTGGTGQVTFERVKK